MLVLYTRIVDMAETEDEKNITLDELRDYFECPICLMPPRC